MKLNRRAFTLIELLVVIAIIGILATISVLALNNARAKSRDAKRAGDMKQIQTALELFFNDKQRYPSAEEWATGQIYSTSTNSTSTYMQIIPSAPTPNDGNCTTGQNSITYNSTSDGSSYSISFCLGNTTGSLTPGPKCLTPGGIVDMDCSAGGSGPSVPQCTGDFSFSGFTTCGTTGTYCGVDYSTIWIDENGGDDLGVAGQCWMQKDLNIGDYIDGFGSAYCINVSGNLDNYWTCQGAEGIQKYCYGDTIANCDVYGGLYEWAEAMGFPRECNNADFSSGSSQCGLGGPTYSITGNHQGICPTGWHIPSYNDNNTLATNLGGISVAGDKMKEVGNSHWNSPSAGTNESQFTALPGGWRDYPDGAFAAMGDAGFFWSTSLDLGDLNYTATGWYLSGGNAYFDSGPGMVRTYGVSVRCIQD